MNDDVEPYTPQEWHLLKSKIEQQLMDHKTFLDRESGSAVVELDQSRLGRLARIDAIQQQQAQKKQVRRIEGEVKLLKRALLRLENVQDEFGYCVECGDEIPFKRLLFRPITRLCIECAQKSELAR